MKLKLKIELECSEWLLDTDLHLFRAFLKDLLTQESFFVDEDYDEVGSIKVLSIKKTKQLTNFIEDLKDTELVKERQSSKSRYITLEELAQL